jgi:hypothetical protein
MNRPGNFFKHADRDAHDILDHVQEEFNDVAIFLAVQCYVALGSSPTKPMRAFIVWFSAIYPDFLLEDETLKPAFTQINAASVQGKPRPAHLALGLSLLRTDYVETLFPGAQRSTV